MQCCHFAVDMSAVEAAAVTRLPGACLFRSASRLGADGPAGADRRNPAYPPHGMERPRHRAVERGRTARRGLVASLLTRDHGRHAGFVPRRRLAARRGRSGSPATWSRSSWRARLSEQLGNYTGELREPHAARALDDAVGAGGPRGGLRHGRCGAARARAASGDVRRLPCLPGRARPSGLACDLCPAGARAAAGAGLRPRPREMCGDRARPRIWPTSRPRPAARCRARPPSPYKDKLLALPAFLSTGGLPADDEQLRQGLDLTGYFLERHVFWPHNKPLPAARARFMETLQRQEQQ